MISLEDFFDEHIKLPSPPTIALKILQAVRNDENSFAEMADIIQHDPALASRVLKVANSALYGGQTSIGHLDQAMGRIGTNALRNIALSFVIMDGFKDITQEGFDIEYFWRRAVITAVASEIVAEQVYHEDDDLFISGLLQEIGVLLLFLSKPLEYMRLRDEKRINREPTHRAEMAMFGFDHAEIGYSLLNHWKLPQSISVPILYHHSEAKEEKFRESSFILNLAGDIASVFSGGRYYFKVRDIQQKLVERYDFSEIRCIELMDRVGTKAKKILELFDMDPGGVKPLSELMDDAAALIDGLELTYEEVSFDLKQARDNAEQLALEVKDANATIRELAFRDSLTGLYNHRYFQELVETELKRAELNGYPVSLMLVDIDFFKEVNETYGHKVGDVVLKEVGKTLKKLVRASDAVARYGGEEFSVLLPETTEESAKIFAQRIRRGVEQLKINTGDNILSVTISVGLVGANDEENPSRSVLLDKSDEALERAKEKGRNRVEVYH